MPIVTFTHYVKQEKIYIKQLFEEKAWFRREKFPVAFPKKTEVVESELFKNEKLLKPKIAKLQKNWKKIEIDYFKVIKEFRHRELLRKYVCHISCFGPEGKYQGPNKIFIRLRFKSDEKRALESIGHELLHLIFAEFFEIYKIKYPEREGIVDALIIKSDLAHIFPHYPRQSVSKIDQKLLKSILI